MSVFRAKNETPQVYTAESRDFQILLRVLDFVQNSIKYDIDAITDIIDTDDISGYYLDRLKNKLGFFTNNSYDDSTLSIPFIDRFNELDTSNKMALYSSFPITKSIIDLLNTKGE